MRKKVNVFSFCFLLLCVKLFAQDVSNNDSAKNSFIFLKQIQQGKLALSNNNVLKLVNYSKPQVFRDEKQKDSLINMVLDTSSKTILFNSHNPSQSVLINSYGNSIDSVSIKLDTSTNAIVSIKKDWTKISLKYLNQQRSQILMFSYLTWNFKGREFKSICFGNDLNGMIFDPVIVNLFALSANVKEDLKQ